MAVAYETERRYPEAIEQYSIVIHLSPKMGEAFYRLATIYLKDKHLAQARVMYANSLVLGQDAEYFRDAKSNWLRLTNSSQINNWGTNLCQT
jgi:tetratricopeptide (TPR) repeat protein